MGANNIDNLIEELMAEYVNECEELQKDPSLLEAIEKWIPERFLSKGRESVENVFYTAVRLKVPTLFTTVEFI